MRNFACQITNCRIEKIVPVCFGNGAGGTSRVDEDPTGATANGLGAAKQTSYENIET
jgi:hypothetical protein